jgi:hypothetical protein
MKRGDHICVKSPRLGDLVTHHGIYCGDGTVIHFDGSDKLSGQAKIRRDNLEDFCHPLPISEILVFKQCHPDDVDAVLERAEAYLGKSGYSLFGNNCEHFATFCMTSEWKSGQAELLDKESTRFLGYVQRLTTVGGSLSITEIAKRAAEAQQDPVKKVLAFTGVVAGSLAVGVVAGTGSYAVRKISQMGSLRKPRSPQNSSEIPSPKSIQAIRGDDLRLDLKLAFREAAFGGKKQIEISRLEQCQTCTETNVQKKILTKPSCLSCNGEGRIQETKRFRISIPAGVDTGKRLKLAGEGDAGRFGGSAGDLYVHLFVDEDKELKRDGANILSTIEINKEYADSGCSLTISTLDGSVSLKIPPGIKSGTVLRLSGRGVPHLGDPSERGDHLVTANIR